MIIVPAFAESENRNKPIVGRIVRRFKAAFAVKMRERIDEPRRVPTENRPHDHAPQNESPTAEQK